MPYDVKAAYRDGATAGDLTDTSVSTALAHPTFMKKGVRVEVVVPQAEGTSPTLKIEFQHSDDGVNFTTKETLSPTITEAGTYSYEVLTPRRFSRLRFVVEDTDSNFGPVSAYLVPI